MNARSLVLAVCLCCAVPFVGQAAWQNVPIPPGMQYARAICDTEPYLYCAFETAEDEAGGLYRTPAEAPGVWEYLGFSGVRVYDIIEATGSEPVLLVGTDDANRIYRSIDDGSTWAACGASLPTDRATALLWDGGSPGRIYCVTRDAGIEAVSVSANQGLSWTTVYSIYATAYLTFLSSRGDGRPNVWKSMFSMYWDSSVWGTTNGGQDWSMLPGVSWTGPPTALCTPAGNQWVYCLIDGGEIRRWNNNLSESSWSVGFYGLDMKTPAWWNGRLGICGVTGDGRLSAAYRSEGDETWTPMNEGLPDGTSPSPDNAWWHFTMEAGAARPVLYFGTWTLGLWRLDLSDVVAVDNAAPAGTNPHLRSLPNPAGTTVRFELDGAAGNPVELQIVDATGRQIVSLRGGKETSWNFTDALGRAVPAGTYYARMGSGSGSDAASVRFVHVR